jgi:hypothetical protein
VAEFFVALPHSQSLSRQLLQLEPWLHHQETETCCTGGAIVRSAPGMQEDLGCLGGQMSRSVVRHVIAWIGCRLFVPFAVFAQTAQQPSSSDRVNEANDPLTPKITVKCHFGRLDKAWDEALATQWTVVSMKGDWKRIFSSVSGSGTEQ